MKFEFSICDVLAATKRLRSSTTTCNLLQTERQNVRLFFMLLVPIRRPTTQLQIAIRLGREWGITAPVWELCTIATQLWLSNRPARQTDGPGSGASTDNVYKGRRRRRGEEATDKQALSLSINSAVSAALVSRAVLHNCGTASA